MLSAEKRKLIAGSGGRRAHQMGKAHTFSHEEAVKAGMLGGRWPNRTKRVYIEDTNSKQSQLLTLLQASLATRPGEPVSFVTLGKELGISRQYARTLYHRLKRDHPVPPVGKKGLA